MILRMVTFLFGYTLAAVCFAELEGELEDIPPLALQNTQQLTYKDQN